MEDRLWNIVCAALPWCKASSRQQYSDRRILLVFCGHQLPMAIAIVAHPRGFSALHNGRVRYFGWAFVKDTESHS